MEVNYNLTEEDYINFNMFHIKNSQSTMRSLKIQRFSIPIIYIILSFVLSNIGDIPFLFLFIPFLIVSIIWVIFYPKYFYKRVIHRIKKMINEGKNDGLIGEHNIIMTEEGIVDSTPTGETKVNWSGINNLKEDQEYLYVYNTSISAYILPKRDLKNVEQIRDYLISRIPQ
ncbi:YcxB family protein [Bacillus sp. ISL-40]|uniref:YcxB family protein n=1 Tax=unclassified Bacillus (in: firmicutes) TaxID=185979 RepID=UPI001BE528D8|nr:MULTISPECIES: YcxB family protein [unclassified Bacillus (in: firmicutes)]MBT2701126.1 YcxB family protein [Bacillus sp. ISL-40]MBT2743649.1 YcxB family protein [Bacillus sp. ISL-77]